MSDRTPTLTKKDLAREVSAALDEGYVLHGSPSITAVAGEVRTAQAVVLPEASA